MFNTIFRYINHSMYLCLIFSITLIEEATLIRYACIVVLSAYVLNHLLALLPYVIVRYLLVQRDQCCIRGSVRPREEEDL